MAEARVEGVGGTAEDGEGEAVRQGGGGRRRGVNPFSLTESALADYSP